MAATGGLNNFRFSIYIDPDGTVTLTDLPPELREVAEALDPSHVWGSTCQVPDPPGADASRDENPPPARSSADVDTDNQSA